MTLPATSMCLAAADPYGLSRTIGAALVPFLLLIAVLKCIQIMRRPTTNTLCVLALTLFLAPFAALGSFVFLMQQMNSPVGGLPLALRLLIGFGFLLCMAAGFVLAIVGLVQYQRNKTVYKQGRKQAFLALVCVTLVFTLIPGYFRTLSHARKAAEASHTAPPGAYQTFPDLNFRIRPPDAAWAKMNAKRVNPDATVAYVASTPGVVAYVIAEKLGVNLGLTEDALLELIEGNLRTVTSQVSQTERMEESHNGITGTRVTYRSSFSGQEVCHTYWLVSHNGFVYQVIANSKQRLESVALRAGKDLADELEILDPDLLAYSDGLGERPSDVNSPAFGYAVTYDARWTAADSIAEQVPEAHTTASSEPVMAFLVVPLRLGKLDLTDSELATAMLSILNFEYPDEVIDQHDAAIGLAAGHCYTLRREIEDDTYRFRLYVLRHASVAYMVAGWASEDKGEYLDAVDEFARTTQFFPPNENAELTDAEHIQQSSLLTSLGYAAYTAKRYQQAIDCFEQAMRHNPANATALDWMLDSYDVFEQYAKAREIAETYLDHFENNATIQANYAYQLARTNAIEKAIEVYQRQFNNGFVSDVYFWDYIDQLAALGRYDDAHAALDEALQQRPTRDLRFRKADLLREQGRYEESVAYLLELRENRSYDPQLEYTLAELHLELSDYGASLEVSTALAESQNSAYAWWLVGQSQMGLRAYPEAKAAYEAALRLDPADEDYRRQVTYVAGLLGRGDNAAVRTPIDPVPIPAFVQSQLAGLPPEPERDATDPSTPSAYYSQLVTGLHYTTESDCRRTEYRTVQIHSRQALDAFSTLALSFDPLREDLFVNSLEVTDEEGKTIAVGDPNTYYVVDDAADSANHDKVLHVPVPSLAVGRSLTYIVTYRTDPAPNRWPFRREIFFDFYPAAYDALFAQGDITHLIHRSSKDVTFISDGETLCWLKNSPPVYRYESRQPYLNTWLPTVELADDRDTWASLAQEYQSALAERLAPDNEVEAIARRLTEGLSAADEVIDVLARYVQREYTYKAIEFGKRARIPNPASEIIHNRYGDCKDHALLLHQLLRAAGQRSCLGLVSSFDEVVPELPALEQFDHMLVYAENLDGGAAIDVTNKSAHVLRNSTRSRILLLDAENPRLIEAPEEVTPGDINVNRTVNFTEQPHASVSETVVMKGVYGEYLRARLDGYPANEQRELIQFVLSDRFEVQVKSLTCENLKNTSAPLILKIDYQVRDVLHGGSQEIVGRLPDCWAELALTDRPTENRMSPFELVAPVHIIIRTQVTPPPNTVVINPESMNRSDASTFGEWSLTATPTADGLVLDGRGERKTGRFAAEEYAEYVASFEQALDVLAPRIIFAPKEGS